MSGEMAVAYFMADASSGNVLRPMLNDGELAVLCGFVFLLCLQRQSRQEAKLPNASAP